MKTVTMHGGMWGRNLANINLIPSSKEPGGQGVYILYDGSMPVYVGKGNMRSRIKSARLGKRRGQLWDHFSWYSLNPQITHDIEALILRMLPLYLRSLTKQKGKFLAARKVKELPENRTAEFISRKVKRNA
jgi:hypothetical protein